MENFKEIWNELKRLDEADFNFGNAPERRKSRKHARDHAGEYKVNEEDYYNIAKFFSEKNSVNFGEGTLEDPKGYLRQDGRKAKITQMYEQDEITPSNKSSIVVYEGDDLTGSIKTLHVRSWSGALNQANPYHHLRVGKEDHRYKSDLNGGLEGLKFFQTPGFTSSLTEEEIEDFNYRLENGQPLPR